MADFAIRMAGSKDFTIRLAGQPIRVQLGENTALALRAADRAELAANTALAAGNFIDGGLAAAEAATAEGEFFSYSDGSGGIIYAVRTAGGSTIIAEAATKSVLDTKADQTDLDATNTALGGLTSDLNDVRSDIGTVATSTDTYTGAPPLSVVASVSTANLADPAAADVAAAGDLGTAIGTTTDNQMHRLRNNATGVLTAASISTLGTFAVTRKMDVTAGQEYTFSLHNAPAGWYIYSASQARIQFFNTDGSFHSEITSGFTVDSASAPRQVTFTVPTGAEKVAFNLRNFVDFSNTNPISSEAMQIVQDNIMLNAGATALPFTPYTTEDFTPSTDLFDIEPEGIIRVERQGDFTYVETACQQSLDKNVIWRVLNGHGVRYYAIDSRSGVVDLWGARFVDKSNAAIPAKFNQSTQVHCTGVDESAPERRNGMFLDGGHGSTAYVVTKAAHGMANVDVGSIWSDGTDQWILLFIDSASTLLFQRRYTGTDTKWSIISAAPASSTFTHVSGATTTGNIAFTSPTAKQFVPVIRDYTSEMKMDGMTVSADGTYSGERFSIEELYKGLNIAKVQDALIADVGNASPDWTPDVAQVRVYNRFEWGRYGALTVYTGRYVVDAYSRAALIDYWGGIQLQRLSLTGDSSGGMHSKSKLYIPDVSSTADGDGGDFSAIRDVTSNAAQVDILASDCDDPANPSATFCLIGTNGADAILSGQAFGYDTAVGLAVPATRAANADRVFYMSSSEKNYPVLLDAGAGDAVSGDAFEATCYRIPFLPTDADLTIPGVVYEAGIGTERKVRCIVAAHQTLNGKEVAVPAEYSGRSVTIMRGEGLTLDNDFVSNGKITVSVAGSHGWAVLELG